MIFLRMSINKILLVLCLIISCTTVLGQKIEIRPGMGSGMYAMKDLRTLLEKSAEESSLGLETTEEFPPYYSYHLDAIYYISKKIGIGLTSGVYSTGARNSIADYSGANNEDVTVKALNLGLIGVFKDSLKDDLFYGIELGSGLKLSDLVLESKFKLYDIEYSEESRMNFTGKGWWVEPRVRFCWNFYKSFTWSTYAGYEFHLKNKMTIKENSQSNLLGKIDWSGFRFGMCVSFILNN